MSIMTETVSLQADDGHTLQAFVAKPEGTPKAGLVVIQEIFGLTRHIKEVTAEFAADGYLAVAPAMFDRVSPDVVLDYDELETGRDTMSKLDLDQCVLDMKAAADFVRSAGEVGVIGYCWGGAMADLAACNGLADAGVSYYGRMTMEWLDKQPTCPMLYHYGELDQLISLEMVEQIQRARKGNVRVWGAADHGFNCKDRPQYHKASATKAREITLAFFADNLD